MIASEDVRRVTFERAMRGYRCEDVDDYLKQVADSMDALSAENEDLQKKLVVLAQRIDQYRAEEDTLRTTMINAQRLGENVIREAKQKAAEIIRAANIKSEDREQHARDEVELAKQELITLKKEADSFKKTLMGMYREHIEVLSKIPEYPGELAQEAAAEQKAQASSASYQEPEPEPQPAQPDPAPAAAPAPTAEPEPAQQPETATYQQPDYYDPTPADPAEEGKINTVEFAIAPKPEEPEQDYYEEPAPQPADELPDASGLYADLAPEPPKKTTRSRSTTKKSTTRKSKTTKQSKEDNLPAAFDSFQGVDYND
nr:DivIVA domain-containing protein [uncultured Gemmiger sp.]